MSVKNRKELLRDNIPSRIIYTQILDQDIEISTVKLPFAHGDYWYETMIFGGIYDEFQQRYITLEEAKRSHIKITKRIING